MEERRTRAVFQRRWLDPETAGDLGTLDAAAIERVREEAWPQVGNADELHDALVELGFLTASKERLVRRTVGRALLHGARTLIAERRFCRTVEGEPGLWVAAERLPQLEAIFPSLPLNPQSLRPRVSQDLLDSR